MHTDHILTSPATVNPAHAGADSPHVPPQQGVLAGQTVRLVRADDRNQTGDAVQHAMANVQLPVTAVAPAPVAQPIGLVTLGYNDLASVVHAMAPASQPAMLAVCTRITKALSDEQRWLRASARSEHLASREGVLEVLASIGLHPQALQQPLPGRPGEREAKVLCRIANRLRHLRGDHFDAAWPAVVGAIAALPASLRLAPLKALLVPSPWPWSGREGAPASVYDAINALSLRDKVSLCVSIGGCRTGPLLTPVLLGFGRSGWLDAVAQLDCAQVEPFVSALLKMKHDFGLRSLASYPDLVQAMMEEATSLLSVRDPARYAAVVAGVAGHAGTLFGLLFPRGLEDGDVAPDHEPALALWRLLTESVPTSFAFAPLCALASSLGQIPSARYHHICARDLAELIDRVVAQAPMALNDVERTEIEVRMMSIHSGDEGRARWLRLMDACQHAATPPAVHRRLAFLLAARLGHVRDDAGWGSLLQVCEARERLLPRDRARLFALVDRAAPPAFRQSARRLALAFELAEHDGQFKPLRSMLSVGTMNREEEARALSLYADRPAAKIRKALDRALRESGAFGADPALLWFRILPDLEKLAWVVQVTTGNNIRHECVPPVFLEHLLTLVRERTAEPAIAALMMKAVLRAFLVPLEFNERGHVRAFPQAFGQLTAAIMERSTLRTDVEIWALLLKTMDVLDAYRQSLPDVEETPARRGGLAGTPGFDLPLDWICARNRIANTWALLHQSGAPVADVLHALRYSKPTPQAMRPFDMAIAQWSARTAECVVDAISRLPQPEQALCIPVAIHAEDNAREYPFASPLVMFGARKQRLWTLIVALPGEARLAAAAEMAHWFETCSDQGENRVAWEQAREQYREIVAGQ